MVQSTTFYLPSSDGIHQLHGLIWRPEGTPKGVIQITHGISEYIGRYAPFASFLAEQGYVVVGHDHLGHGETANHRRELGFFADRGGWHYVLEDVRRVHLEMADRFPQLPYVLMGHSMGSFVARLYLIDYPGCLDGCILSGTGQGAAPLVGFGRGLSGLLSRVLGSRHVSKLITSLSLGAYNKQFRPNRTHADWLSRDEAAVDAYVADPLCRFVPTVSMFADMMAMIQQVGSAKRLTAMDRELPIYLFSGQCDPVGDCGKGVEKVCQLLQNAGVKDVSLKLYPEGRHEMLQETNRLEVYQDVLGWLEGKLGT